MGAFQKAALRLLPSCFVFGAGVEWFMCRVKIGNETFYDTVVRLEAERKQEEDTKL